LGTVRFGGVKFRLYAGDHEGKPIPHVHARFDGGEVVIELLDDGSVRLSEAHNEPIAGLVKRSDVRKALRVAAVARDALLLEWRRMRR
jgi:hypothetical protein